MIENVEPEVSCGRFPIKRVVTDTIVVEADVFGDGHDEVRARLLWKQDPEPGWKTVEMQSLGNDRWRGKFPVTQVGCYRYTIAGEEDHFGTWQHDLKKTPRRRSGSEGALPFRSDPA